MPGAGLLSSPYSSVRRWDWTECFKGSDFFQMFDVNVLSSNFSLIVLTERKAKAAPAATGPATEWRLLVLGTLKRCSDQAGASVNERGPFKVVGWLVPG